VNRAHPPTDGPAFFFDLGSPDAYLLAERVLPTMPVATEWIPVLAAELPGAETYDAFRCEHERDIVLGDFAAAAARRGLQPLRWPDPFPFDSEIAMRAATYARQIGRTVAFSLAAFRQAFAAGRDLSERDNVLIAGAACEMHPAALIKGADLRGTREKLEAASAQARAEGVRSLPAVVVGDRVLHGERAVPVAA